jgi:glycosyltransferase involved in cell wall biosynthesis
MLIGIDGNEANQKIRVGSGVYAFELLKQFKKYQISNIKYQIYLKEPPIIDLPEEFNRWRYKIVRPNKLWTQIGLPIKLWEEKIFGKAPDLFFTPTHYAPHFCPVSSVITIFDLSFIRFPEMFLKKDLYKLKSWTDYSIKQAKKIITISQFSKKEITDYYHVPQENVIVAYPGYDGNKYKISNIKNKKYIEKIKKKYKIDGDYLLYVGTIQPRKNLVRLIEAFELMNRKYPELKLVICGMINEGRGGWMNEEFFHAISNQQLTIHKDVIITGFVSEDDLPYLMSGAKSLVLPSLYEGFGIPVIEAMACGIPVVVSNTSSLPEVVEKAGILVNPYEIGDITRGLTSACFDENKRKEMIKRGLERVKLFSWQKTAKIVLEVLIESYI